MSLFARAALTKPRSLRWVIGFALAIMTALGLVLLFLLTQATSNRDLYERHYRILFAVNMVVAGVLLLGIGWVAWRLLQRLRQKKFGSHLLVRLATVFVLASFAPGVLIYVVSYQFVARSIDSWFDVKVEGALQAGLNLGRSTLEVLSADLVSKSLSTAGQLADALNTDATLPLERARQAMGINGLQLWSAGGKLVAAVGQSDYQLTPEVPMAQQFRLARSQGAISWIEGLDDAEIQPEQPVRIMVLALVGSDTVGTLGQAHYLLAEKVLPPALVQNAQAVTRANREYQERALAREGLRRMYIGTLTLSLFMAVFGGVLLAVVLGNQIARPLLVLADGVRAVAGGDLSPKISLSGKDELDGLTRSFADMTQQLLEARQAVQHSMAQTNAARANLQTILDNLTAGVLVLNPDGTMISFNPGAERILKLPLAAYQGRRLDQIEGLQDFGAAVAQQFEAFLSQHQERQQNYWQHSFELGGAAIGKQPNHSSVTLIARGAELPGNKNLLVFDDISEVVSAQRVQAWGEVARRLAHEIKNPLTPIQLSAERLKMKLSDKLDGPAQQLLHRSIKTIVDQVDAMKRLVNEFRDYARLPAAQLEPLELNALVQDVLNLYVADHARAAIACDLDPACPAIQGDPQQLRQVLHNLLQNAQDANASAWPFGAPEPVRLKTQWQPGASRVRLSVQDSGGGFPDHILKRAFEPYVTTKEKGTGLGLAVVKKIADEHGARIEINNRLQAGVPFGAEVSLSFSVRRVLARQTASDCMTSAHQRETAQYGEYISGG